ncbi:MAG: hypothetical protein QNJ70_29115 [Xenococcaceae cyanobacterium MO_207.B15]|nr:hypothetical protein [Xenococcaceae cyanobacterium MO_207.B15]
MSLWLIAALLRTEELEEILYTRCQVILQQPELVKGITNFSWWLQSSLTTAV